MRLHIPVRGGVRTCAVALTLLLVLASAGTLADARETTRPVACASAGAQPQAASIRDLRSATLCLINAERTRRGLPRLHLDRQLALIGASHARDMVRRGYFNHETPDGRGLRERVADSRYVRAARRRWSIGETLAWGHGTHTTPREIVRAWMDSPTHRRVLLARRFRDLGLAVVRRAPVDVPGPSATYVAELGRR